MKRFEYLLIYSAGEVPDHHVLHLHALNAARQEGAITEEEALPGTSTIEVEGEDSEDRRVVVLFVAEAGDEASQIDALLGGVDLGPRL